MNTDPSEEIKRRKGEFWSAPGAADTYERNVFSKSGVVQIKNQVELTLVLRHARGHILDAGTGTGRFAIPLAMVEANSVVALDYSQDMLDLNRKVAAAQGVRSIEYVRGDVEHLPFKDGEFESVVSITVVRHFPQWRAILDEYIRVLRPGGKLVFEMCSGDHINAANRIVRRFGAEHRKDGFLSYEAEVPFGELRQWLEARGVDVVERHTYDFLNSNCFLKIITLNDLGYRALLKLLRVVLSVRPLQRLVAWLELNLLARLPTLFSYNYMVVGRKR